MLVIQLICFLLKSSGVQHKVFFLMYLSEHMAVKRTTVKVHNSVTLCVVSELFIAMEKFSLNGH